MRKILCICFVVMAMITGCGHTELSDISTDNQQDLDMEIFTEREETNMIDYTRIDSVHLVDAIPDEYSEAVSVDIKKEDVDNIKLITDQFELNNVITLKKPWYSIELLDENGMIIDVWTVDTYRTIQTLNGGKIKRIGNIDIMLSQIEEKYGITKQLLERSPGSNYFYGIGFVNKGVFQKIVETNFDNNYKFVMSSEMINAIKENKDDIQIGSELKTNYDVEYVIALYNDEGNVLYTFHIDKDGNLYTNCGYSLYGSFVKEWISEVMQVALKE
ncbi:MAG: hypothetical protein NC177_13770 [Ruminococcus flavefaciens]|nr:hypothetical protein [Ruminococcus flavefaciens]